MSKLYLNKPQYEGYLVDGFEEYNIWPRGMGKSSGRIAPRTASMVFSMPRGHFVYVARTFQQLLTRTLPGVIQGLARMGYHQDKDYFIGSFAPKAWKWDKPFAPPVKGEYFMHWRNGSGFSFVSQDRPGMAAGLSIDGIIGDEGKHLKQDLLEEELMPANRGNKGVWAGTSKDRKVNDSLHHSIMICSDMPVSASARWLLEKDKDQTPEKVQEILTLQIRIIDLQNKYKTASSKSYQQKLYSEIVQLSKIVQRIRRGDPDKYARFGDEKYKPTVMYSEPDIWNNIHVLGLEYIDQQKRLLPDLIFQTSILNKRATQVENGFYPDLSETKHGYDKFSSSYFELQGYAFDKYAELDSRQDGDVNPSDALDMAPDYGGNFNCIVIGQHHGTEYRVLKAMHVKKPDKIADLVKAFKKYYRHHKNKTINFYYDHTGKRTDAISQYHYHEEYTRLLQAKDEYGKWNVNARYVGRTPPPIQRFEFLSKLLREEDPRLPKLRYNRQHAEYWAISCMLAPMKITTRGFEKDKAAERKETPQEEATHYSDAGDTLLFFRLQEGTTSTVPGGIAISNR